MNPYEETIATWSKIAPIYEAKFMNMTFYDITYKAFCNALLSDRAKILEIGCGPGNITQKILGLKPNLRLLATDVSPNMVDLAKKNNPTAQFKVIDARAISQLTDTFDGIIIGFCIPYLSEEDCDQLLIDCASMVNKNGLLYISFVEGLSEQSGFKVGSSGDRAYFYYHTLERLKTSIQSHQFSLQDIWHIDYPINETDNEVHTVMLLRKE